ncbi:MAG: RNA polymerase sigma factor [Oscillospiraceae bacterium]|jgi:RNA polymerase sigma-70 factor (ECF subfamily)|nr:RNA polymerase sigma factor [Oscillospiraceae bacterium]
MTDDTFAERIVAMTPTLYRVCYSELREASDREDAVQEALTRAWQKRASLRDERFMQTWLVRILINECRNIQRRRPAQTLDELPAPPPGADVGLHDSLLSLPDKLRLPMVLHYIEGYKVEEIAKMLGVPQGTVKSRLYAARREMREKLSEEAEYTW